MRTTPKSRGPELKLREPIDIESGEERRHSLARLVTLLRVSRHLFVGAGAAFFLWELSEAFLLGAGVTTQEVIDVIIVSVVGPAFVWVSSRWGERLGRESIQSHWELQHEVGERRRAEEALRESEGKLRLVLSNLAEVVYTVSASEEESPGGRVELVTPQVANVVGYLPDEFVQDSTLWLSLIHPKDMPGIVKRTAEVYATKQVKTRVYRVRHKNGEYRWMEDRVVPRLDDTGQVVEVFGVARDVTERKQAEEALRESEERYRAVVENVADAITITVGEKRVFANRAFLNLTGLDDLAQVLEMPVGAHVVPEDRARAQGYLLARQRGEATPGLHEVRIRRPDGVVRTIQSSAVATTYQGEPAVLAVVRDITELKQAEEALRESEERYRAVVEAIADAISVVVGTERVFVNRAFLELYGFDNVSQVVGMQFDQFIFPEDRERVRRLARAQQRGGEIPRVFEHRIRRSDGEVRTVQVSAARITYRGQPASLAVIRDITELKKVEEELRSAQEQLLQADRLAAMGQLISGIVHDVNNPLTIVLSCTQALLDKESDDAARRELETIRGEAERAAKIVQNLLTFARKNPLAKSALSINEILRQTLELQAYEMRVNKVVVETELQPDLPNIMADFQQLQQVFLNIIINAEQAMGRNGGRLRVTTWQRGQSIQVIFADNGPGIAKQHLAKLFDPFFTTKEPGQGTGLGLSICYGIVREHGGRIWASSREGKGATFTVKLPLADESATNPQP